jgi:hypothetical protein
MNIIDNNGNKGSFSNEVAVTEPVEAPKVHLSLEMDVCGHVAKAIVSKCIKGINQSEEF